MPGTVAPPADITTNPYGATPNQVPLQGVPLQGAAQHGVPAFASADVTKPFSIGAILALVGSVVVIASYFLAWYVVADDTSVTVNGWGSVSDPAYEFTTVKLHWLLLVAGLVAPVVAVVRLLGKYTEEWKRGSIAVIGAAAIGALSTLFLPPDGGELTTGAYLGSLGGLVIAAGVALIAFAKR